MLTIATARRYASRAGAKSSAWFGDRIKTWRTSAHRETGAFFASTVRVMVAVRGRLQSLPGSKFPGSPTCVQPPPLTVWRQSGMAPQNLETYPWHH